MPIRDILLLCDASEVNDFRIETTLSFARDLKAHVTGVHLIPHPVVPMYDGGFGVLVPYSGTEELARHHEIASEIEAKLDAKANEYQVSYDWVTFEGINAHPILDLARYNDVVIVPQGYSRFGERFMQSFEDYLVVHLGRPLIVLPDLKVTYELPQRIMIAWDESHEAARAVHDSLRFLQIAKNVQIITVVKNETDERKSMIRNDDLRKHLSRHDIEADVLSVDRSVKGTGATILQAAIEHDSDLIVMGAYGHTRLTEAILGGATSHLLKHSTIPLLLSH